MRRTAHFSHYGPAAEREKDTMDFSLSGNEGWESPRQQYSDIQSALEVPALRSLSAQAAADCANQIFGFNGWRSKLRG